LATGARALRESARTQGSCPTVVRAVRSTALTYGPRVLDPTAGARTWQARVARPRALEEVRGTGSSRPRSSARTPNPRFAGANSRGEQAQESTDRGDPGSGQSDGRHENGLSRRAKLRSGRAGCHSGEPGRNENGAAPDAQASVRHLATRGNRRHGLAVGPPAKPASPARGVQAAPGSHGKRSTRRGNEPRTSRHGRAVGQSNANPHGSTRPARAGTAPREGKAL